MHTRPRLAVAAVLSCVAAGLVAASSARAVDEQGARTSVRVSFVGPDGEPAALTKARLLIAAWGEAEIIELSPEGHGVTLDVSPTARPEWARGFSDFRAYLYVESDGYAPILSQPFDWVHPPDAPSATLDFRQGSRATVRAGDRAQLQVRLRRPVPRRVRLVDERGAPFPGVGVEAAVFWTDSNHCGWIRPDLPVGGATTDADGWLSLPDGDFEYALFQNSPDAQFPAEGGRTGHELVLPLGEPQTLVAHRIVRRPLRMSVIRDGRPVPGLSLYSELAHCPCGACGGREGVTDASGEVTKENWAQERIGTVWLCDGTRLVWSSAAKDIPAGQLVVRLPVANPDVTRGRLGCTGG